MSKSFISKKNNFDISFDSSLKLKFRAIELGIGPNKHMRGLTKKYAKRFPESPKNVDEIIEYFAHSSIASTTGQTLRGENERTTSFFKHAYQCDDFSYCVFASDDVIEIINTIQPDKRMLFCDGTFHIVPHGAFSQLLILSADICGQVNDHSLKNIESQHFSIVFTSFALLFFKGYSFRILFDEQPKKANI